MASADLGTKDSTKVDSPAPGTEEATGENVKKRSRDSTKSGLTPASKKGQNQWTKAKPSKASKSKERRERKKLAKSKPESDSQAKGFVNKYKIPKIPKNKADTRKASTSTDPRAAASAAPRASASGAPGRPAPRVAVPTPTATKGAKETGARPKTGKAKSYASAAKGSSLEKGVEEVGDLSDEAISEIQASSSEEPANKKGRLTTIPLFIHSGREFRLPMDAIELGEIWSILQREIIMDKKAKRDFVCNIAFFGHREGRGVIACENEQTVAYIKEKIQRLHLNGKLFRAWDKGSSGTTLVTVILHDKGLMSIEDIREAVVVMNELDELGPLHAFRVAPMSQRSTSRIVRFGACGALLDKLRSLDSKLMVGGLTCKMSIKPDKPEKSSNDQDNDSEPTGSKAADVDAVEDGGLENNMTSPGQAMEITPCAAPTQQQSPWEASKTASPSHAEGVPERMDVTSSPNPMTVSTEEEEKLLNEDE